MKQIKNSVKLTIFTALLIMSVTFILYLLLITDLSSELSQRGIYLSFGFFSLRVAVFFVLTAVLAFFTGSVIVDKLLNPVRIMTSKVRHAGSTRLIEPLTVSWDDDELREYALAFNEMSRKLNGYTERQNRFISDAAHELSTPVTVINGHADLLLRWGKSEPDTLDNGLQTIKAEVLRMSELIDSLLLLARSDNSRQVYNFENIPLSKLLEKGVDEAKLIAPDFEFELETCDDSMLKCDEYALLRVLRIILSNAVKYSGESRVINIKAGTAGGLVSIAVKDYGIGIGAEDISHIFERFYRADASRSKRNGSSGLGLSIAEEIVKAHGGSIRVESAVGLGSEFTVTLPS